MTSESIQQHIGRGGSRNNILQSGLYLSQGSNSEVQQQQKEIRKIYLKKSKPTKGPSGAEETDTHLKGLWVLVEDPLKWLEMAQPRPLVVKIIAKEGE